MFLILQQKPFILTFRLSLFLTVFSFKSLFAQTLYVSGTVYDYFSRKPLTAVSVFSSSGNFTISDSLGKYQINVSKKDSIWFSYLSKNTMKYVVDTINNPSSFEIALYLDAHWLPTVTVKSNNYILDSLQNRLDYAKVFNFKKPGLAISSNPPSTYVPGSLTVGLDLDELINAFRFRRTRQMLSLQQRLIEEEHDKYINHRYTKYFVKNITKLTGTELDSFMMYARPLYDDIIQMNDIELGYYIEQQYDKYMALKKRFRLPYNYHP